MENDKTFELISKMYGEMQEGFERISTDFKVVNERLDVIEKRVINIENDHGKKLDLLFDGYKQNSEQLNIIEKEVSKHEEIILRRVK